MKALVIGCNGMLGTDLVEEVGSRGHEVQGLDLPEFDLTNPECSARLAAGGYGEVPGWVFNCAAYTAVDKAETERDSAFLVNGIGPGYLAQACSLGRIKLIHISTDFVFDGRKSGPYVEEDPTNPLGIYGESKLEGERAVLPHGAMVVRTAWLYGPNGPSFPRTIIKAWLAEKKLRVVSDQRGCPTYTADLTRVLVDLAEKNAYPGIYHAVGPDEMNWHDLAVRAVDAYGDTILRMDRSVEIEPINTADWPTPAARPKYSVLSTRKIEGLGIKPMRSIEDALTEFVKRLPHVL